MSRYSEFKKTWLACTECDVACRRKKVVLARGSVPCDVLFIGEAPGASEDVLGKPFAGPAGKLLDGIIKEAMLYTFSKDQQPRIGFTSLVACIPKDEDNTKLNEPPKEMIENCSERLNEFVRMCDPKLIVLVGKLAKKTIYGQAQFGGQFDSQGVGQIIDFAEILHPASILQANITQKELAIQRCIVMLIDAFENLRG